MKVIERTAAANAGQPLYYTGKSCKNGHKSERYVRTGGCVACARITSAKDRNRIRKLLADSTIPDPTKSPHELQDPQDPTAQTVINE